MGKTEERQKTHEGNREGQYPAERLHGSTQSRVAGLSHQDRVRDLFDKVAIDFGEKGCGYFDYFGERLVAHAHLKNHEKILDVATGKGAVLLAASRRCPQSSLIGVDLSENMLAEARKRVPPTVDLQKMGAEHLAFDDHSFDVVFCAFAIIGIVMLAYFAYTNVK